ncbi:MAG: tRNA (adenosine(37)-N6)-threonylcarbamoyltransferase complex ATPase subunit type 1 TsaE [Rhodospirillales bacterium]
MCIVRTGDVLALWGDLGSGRAVFARGFIRARTTDEEVPSPTFTLVQTYEPADVKGAAVWHFDLYRLGDPGDAIESSTSRMRLPRRSALIEWPDRLGPLLPAHRLDLTLSAGDNPNRRRLTIAGDSRWRARLQEAGVV